ncbi:MAG: hypothetical protein LBG22_11195 [Treponema sp.]|jgi:hypothetical protein|nr:hypothetical protein [Treponema sp.]
MGLYQDYDGVLFYSINKANKALDILKGGTMSKCNVCYYYYENGSCTNEDSPNYSNNVEWDDTCNEGEFDDTIADPDDYDGDDEED